MTKKPADVIEHPIDELICLTPAQLKKALADFDAGKEITFQGATRDGATRGPFTIRCEHGGFKVRAADGSHVGSYADLGAAWRAGSSEPARPPLRRVGRDPWGKDVPRTMALLRR